MTCYQGGKKRLADTISNNILEYEKIIKKNYLYINH